MIKQFIHVGTAAVALAATAMPAAAAPAKGYRVDYVAERGHYCITPLVASESYRLGITLNRTECHSVEDWATFGITLSRA